MADFSYIGVGKVYLREVGSAAGLIEVGNVSALSGNVTEDVRELRDFTQRGGGTYNEVRRIQSVEMAATLHDMSAANLARVVFGSAAAISTSAVVDESHANAFPGSFVPTNSPAATITTVKVGATTLDLNDDYTVVPGGILITDDGAIDYMGDTVLISYTPSAGNVVQALVTSSKEYEVFFSGLNEARSGKAVTFHGFRWKMGAATNLNLIGEDYLAMEVTGKLLKDTTKDGVAESQYYKVSIVT